MQQNNIVFIRKLKTQIEAGIMKEELDTRKIPHIITSFHDSAYDGLFQIQQGWGKLEAPEKYTKEINDIYIDLFLS